MFQKKLEVPPILISSDGSFVGQSKKTVNELRDKYSEPMDNLELLDAIVDDRLNHCSRCRTRGTACDGKQGRACAPCKKSKLSCNLSSTRVPTAKSKGEFMFTCIRGVSYTYVTFPDMSKKPGDTDFLASAISTRPRTSERSSTPTQRKLQSWVEGLGVPNAVLNREPIHTYIFHTC